MLDKKVLAMSKKFYNETFKETHRWTPLNENFIYVICSAGHIPAFAKMRNGEEIEGYIYVSGHIEESRDIWESVLFFTNAHQVVQPIDIVAVSIQNLKNKFTPQDVMSFVVTFLAQKGIGIY